MRCSPQMVGAMYPPGFQTTVALSSTTQGMCGDARPGHFDGVTTVVMKLFAITRADVAVFGEKDYQQLVTLRTMARDLDLDVEVIGAPLVREPDGLAMSSRNVYLSVEDRERARALSRGLFAARDAFQAGQRDGSALIGTSFDIIWMPSASSPEYLELRDADDLRPITQVERPAVLLMVARFGATRLLDNVILRD